LICTFVALALTSVGLMLSGFSMLGILYSKISLWIFSIVSAIATIIYLAISIALLVKNNHYF